MVQHQNVTVYAERHTEAAGHKLNIRKKYSLLEER